MAPGTRANTATAEGTSHTEANASRLARETLAHNERVRLASGASEAQERAHGDAL
ncbi:MAG: hypothetical protein QOI71_2662 [Gaiellales bacterium]|nr:hypothetical protein [Gaiellales bacterium]